MQLSIVRKALISIVATLGLTVTATAGHHASGKSADIVDVAVAAGQFSTLAAALEAAGLVDTLKGEGPFTVFAPTDEAFAALRPATGVLLEALADASEVFATLARRASVLDELPSGLEDDLAQLAQSGQLLRQLGVDDPAADLCTGCGQCIDVIDIQRLQGVADACRQAVVFQVVPEGLRRGGKTVGHPHTLAGEGLVHLAERGVLAANQRYIIDA